MYYEDNVKVKIDWKKIILRLILIVLFVLLIIWLFPMPKLDSFYSKVYNDNLNTMKEASENYFTEDKLPTNTGSSVTLKLQEMLDKKLVTSFTDKNNNECSTTNSYAQVTKTENNNYVLKVQLSCDDKTDYILENLTTTKTSSSSKSSSSETSNTTKDDENEAKNDNDEDDGIVIDESILNSTDSKYSKSSSVEYEYKRAITKTASTYTCPDGYVMDNNVCYRYNTGETIDATPLYFDDVVTTTDAKVNTTGGYTKTAEVIKTVTSTEEVCPEGYTKNGNICYKYVSATVVPGTTTYSCPDGYVLNGTSCTTTVDASANDGSTSYSCPNGYTMSADKKSCTYTISATISDGSTSYSCPNGYAMSADKKSCYYTINATRNTTSGTTTCSCPSGYYEVNGTCTKTNYYTGTYHSGTTTYSSCPSGWTASGSSCIKAANVSVSWTNPNSYTSSTQQSEYNNGTTKRVQTKNPTCTLKGCTYYYTTYTAKKSYSCSSGSLSGTNCVMSRSSYTSSSYYTCNDGRQQSSSTCSYTTTTSKNCTTTSGTTTYTCPSGYVLNGTSCVYTINSTITTGSKSYTCPSGYVLNGTSCVYTINSTVTTGSKSYTCPAGYTLNGTKCSKTINATATTSSTEYTCPSGYVREGTTCYQYTEPTTKKNYSYSCPSGYTQNGEGEKMTCTLKVEATTTYYCEKEDEQLVDNKCVKTVKGGLRGYSCPSGYILNKDKCVKKTLECTSPEEVTTSSTSYEYKWSSDSNLDGWTQTGKTRSTSLETENLYDK